MSQTSTNSPQADISGSWYAEATETNENDHFPVLVTFTGDGSVLGSVRVGHNATDTTAHGNWHRASQGEVACTLLILAVGPGDLPFHKSKVTLRLQRDAGKDTWSGRWKQTVYGASDQVTTRYNGTLTLTRIAVESLD